MWIILSKYRNQYLPLNYNWLLKNVRGKRQIGVFTWTVGRKADDVNREFTAGLPLRSIFPNQMKRIYLIFLIKIKMFKYLNLIITFYYYSNKLYKINLSNNIEQNLMMSSQLTAKKRDLYRTTQRRGSRVKHLTYIYEVFKSCKTFASFNL